MSHQQPQSAAPVDTSTGPPAAFRCVPSEWGVGAVRIHASGELDVASVPQLTEALRHAFTSARLVLLDLSDLTFIETTGIHEVVDATSRALNAGNRLVLVAPPASVSRVFALTRTEDAVEVLDISDGDPPAGLRTRRMSDPAPMTEPTPRSVTQELGNALVALHKEQFGRGPTRGHVHFAGPDALLIVLEDALLPAERALIDAGEGLRVVETRTAFQTATASKFVDIIERITGRTVRSFTGAIDAPESIAYEICLFEPRETGF